MDKLYVYCQCFKIEINKLSVYCYDQHGRTMVKNMNSKYLGS